MKQPSKNDQEKLFRVIGYLEGTKGESLKLEPQGLLKLQAFVDASFSTHLDGKSHSGVYVSIGGAPIYYSSRKQKCVSKSPTEAELVALSDNVNQVELFQELLEFMVNGATDKPVIHQDNTAVITLVTQGGGVARTKHMRTRMQLVLEAVKEN